MLTLKDAQTLLPYLSEDELRAWREPYTKLPVKDPVVARPFHGISKIPELEGLYQNTPKDHATYYSPHTIERAIKPLCELPKGSITREEAWSLFVFLLCVKNDNLSPEELIEPYKQSDWTVVLHMYLHIFILNADDKGAILPFWHEPLLCYAGYMLRELVEWDEFKGVLKELALCVLEHRPLAFDGDERFGDLSTPSRVPLWRYNSTMCLLLKGFLSHCDVAIDEAELLVELCVGCYESRLRSQKILTGELLPIYNKSQLVLMSHLPLPARIEQVGLVTDVSSTWSPPEPIDEIMECLIWRERCENPPMGISAFRRSRKESFPEAWFMRSIARFGDEVTHGLMCPNHWGALSDCVLSVDSACLIEYLTQHLVRHVGDPSYPLKPLSPTTAYPNRLMALILHYLAKPEVVWPLMRDKLLGMAQHGHIELIKQAITSLDEETQLKIDEQVLQPFDEVLPQKSWPAEAKCWYELAQDRESLRRRWRACMGDDEPCVCPNNLQVVPMLELTSGGFLPADCTLGFIVFGMEGKLAAVERLKESYTSSSLEQLCWCAVFQRSSSEISVAEERVLAPFMSHAFIDLMVQSFEQQFVRRKPADICVPFQGSLNGYMLYRIREFGERLRPHDDKKKYAQWKSAFSKVHHITQDELADLSVWDFGLCAQGKRVLSYGEREFELSLSGLEVTLRDVQKQAIVKRLPPKRKSDDLVRVAQAKQVYKTVNKPLQAELATQAKRLEEAMLFKRSWTFGQAQERLFAHPVFAALACPLIWVVPSELELGSSKGMFRVTRDGSVIDVDMAAIKISAQTEIRIASPEDLSPVIPEWAEHLTCFEIIQPFVQLDHIMNSKNEEMIGVFDAFIAHKRVLSCQALQMIAKQKRWSIEWLEAWGSQTKRRAIYMSLMIGGEERFRFYITHFTRYSIQTTFTGWKDVTSGNEGPLMTTARELSSEVFSALLTLLTECELKA